MTMTKARVVTTDSEIDAAIAEAKAYDDERPRAVKVRYAPSRDAVIVALSNGVTLSIPRGRLQGLENAKRADLAKVRIEDFGSALHWDTLDVDHYVPGLLQGVLGTQKWMQQIGAKGGSTTTAAKQRAARRNGSKGGRPRKYALPSAASGRRKTAANKASRKKR